MLFKFHYEILIAAKHFYFLFFHRPFSVSFSYADSFQTRLTLENAHRRWCFCLFLLLFSANLVFLLNS